MIAGLPVKLLKLMGMLKIRYSKIVLFQTKHCSFMNITFGESVYCNEKGEHYRMENFMVRFRQILYIQIPDSKVSI